MDRSIKAAKIKPSGGEGVGSFEVGRKLLRLLENAGFFFSGLLGEHQKVKTHPLKKRLETH